MSTSVCVCVRFRVFFAVRDAARTLCSISRNWMQHACAAQFFHTYDAAIKKETGANPGKRQCNLKNKHYLHKTKKIAVFIMRIFRSYSERSAREQIRILRERAPRIPGRPAASTHTHMCVHMCVRACVCVSSASLVYVCVCVAAHKFNPKSAQ